MVRIWQIYLWNQLSMSTWLELFCLSNPAQMEGEIKAVSVNLGENVPYTIYNIFWSIL